MKCPLRIVPAVLFFTLLLWAPSAGAQDVSLRGFVRDAASGQALTGANVALQGLPGPARGAATDADGFYLIGGVAPGRYALRVSYVGYLPYTDTLALSGERTPVQVNAELEPAAQELEKVTVAAESGAAKLEAGRQRIRPADLKRIPTPGPGGDLTMYLQTLPGVVSAGDRGGQLFVRGGTPSQNLVLLDGTLVYQPFHIVGFFSAFPQDLISEVDFYAGGFPAEYAGRISSVLDVSTRAGNYRRFEGSASLGPFLTGVSVEGPVREGLSFLASVRTSVIERTAPTVVGEDLPLKFGDQFIKVQSSSDTGGCSVAGLHTYDRGKIDLESDDVFRWQNYVVAGRCLAFSPGSPLIAELKAGVSYYENEAGSIDESLGGVDDLRTASTWRLNTDGDLSYQMGDLNWSWGFRVRAGRVSYQLQELFQGAGTAEEDLTIRGGMHGGVTWTPGDRLTLAPSLAFTKPEGLPVSLEPRLRALWRPWGTGAHQLSAAAGLYRQTLVGLTDERDAGSAFTAWQFAPDERQPEALHGLLGWRSAVGGGLDLSAEGYYKRLTDLLVPTWDTNARFTTALGPATGTSYGFDARVELNRAPFYGYLGYGYSWTEYALEQEVFSEIFGDAVQTYHPQHDRRHQLNAVGSVDLGAWQASVRWEYGSGLPYTAPLGFDAAFDLRTLPDVRTELGDLRFLFEQPFNERLPAYHRLDVSAERTFDFAAADVTLEAGAINLYNRANLFYFDLFTLSRVDQLPLVPYLSLQISIP